MRIINRDMLFVPLDGIQLKTEIAVPQNAHALVLFAHGSGSSRLSPRNQMVASHLNEHGMATVLFDLLTQQEDKVENRFNIELLACRLKEVTQWMLRQKIYKGLPIGYFGASTGAAAALSAASELSQVAAVVSRGGRPDLAMKDLPFVKAPTLLIVGGADKEVLKLNQRAFLSLHCEKRLEVIPEASHLFEEKGSMANVCVLAANWFEMHLQPLQLYE